MSAKLYLPIDGNFTSNEFTNLLSSLGVNEASIGAVRPHISNAVIAAQVGQGLSQFAGIAQVAMDAAPQAVANATSTERGASL